MSTTVGQAYVQIIPSAKGFKNKISDEIGGMGNPAGKSFISGMTKAFAGAVALKKAGEGLVATIMEGAKLEQAIGGIETLYGNGTAAYKKMMDYANQAYKTAGLSGREYMETVTGFSASLRQALNGDMDKVADVANMAMIDMSDNANKFGTNMESVQMAYQGFAKQNYTMLDNLKLGRDKPLAQYKPREFRRHLRAVA